MKSFVRKHRGPSCLALCALCVPGNGLEAKAGAPVLLRLSTWSSPFFCKCGVMTQALVIRKDPGWPKEGTEVLSFRGEVL